MRKYCRTSSFRIYRYIVKQWSRRRGMVESSFLCCRKGWAVELRIYSGLLSTETGGDPISLYISIYTCTHFLDTCTIAAQSPKALHLNGRVFGANHYAAIQDLAFDRVETDRAASGLGFSIPQSPYHSRFARPPTPYDGLCLRRQAARCRGTFIYLSHHPSHASPLACRPPRFGPTYSDFRRKSIAVKSIRIES